MTKWLQWSLQVLKIEKEGKEYEENQSRVGVEPTSIESKINTNTT